MPATDTPAQMEKETEMISTWDHCYDDGWKGEIVPDAFCHPAKFSRGLITRIYDYCIEEGWLSKGAVVGDPFGGVGLGGIIAAYRGLAWVGVELEPRFVALAERNFELHRRKWETLGVPMPLIIQGDSRRFAELARCEVVVSSPPYAESHQETDESPERKTKWNQRSDIKAMRGRLNNYSQTDGQIGRLKAGNVDAVLASPPYAEQCVNGHRENRAANLEKAGIDSKQWLGERRCTQGRSDGYGTTPGQIAGLSEGKVDAVVGSPPFEDQEGAMKMSKFKFLPSHGKGHPASDTERVAALTRYEHMRYGETNGQIGNSKGETYWQACELVYRSCHEAIKPGGIIVLVVKEYVQKRQRVPLCDDTCRLLEHCGFTVFERVHAMLVKETRHADLFGGETVKVKAKKSFFRRLAESKGSPPIDYEEVIFAWR